MTNMTSQLILASTSIYRKSLLEKLSLPFTFKAPDIDETPFKNESPDELVKRLSKQKALEIAKTNPEAIIIGSDQVCTIDGQITGKPLTEDNAIQQLVKASGKKITFYTGLCVYSGKTQQISCDVELFNVYFKTLSLAEIEFYVKKEQPLYCAGSFKSEGLGIALFEKLEGRDPNILIGLPLILLIEMLKTHGINVLAK